MSVWRCVHTGILMERHRSGLSEADHLRIEAHVEECHGCDEQARMLGALGALMDSMPAHSLSRRARERALAAALCAAADADSPDAQRQPGQAFLIGGSLVAAAAVAILCVILGGRAPDREARTAHALPRSGSMFQEPASTAPGASRLLWGDLDSDGRALAVGQAVRPHTRQHTTRGARFRLGSAEILLAPSGIVHWEPNGGGGGALIMPPAGAPTVAPTVALVTGGMTVDIADRPERSYRVVTKHFIVEIASARITIDSKRVRVLQGSARVLAADGTVHVTSLEAGHTWRYRPRPGDIAALLKQARAHIASQRVSAARTVIARVHAGELTQRQSAEADTLLAECALVSGDQAGAAQRYEQVAERYPLLTAGEMALFAAARLRARTGDENAARSLLQRYIARYPAGRFREQARSNMRAMKQP